MISSPGNFNMKDSSQAWYRGQGQTNKNMTSTRNCDMCDQNAMHYFQNADYVCPHKVSKKRSMRKCDGSLFKYMIEIPHLENVPLRTFLLVLKFEYPV